MNDFSEDLDLHVHASQSASWFERKNDSLALTSSFARFLLSSSESTLGNFQLQHFSKSCLSLRTLKQTLTDLIRCVVAERILELDAPAERSKERHRREQKALTQQMLSAIVKSIEERFPQILLTHVTAIARQLRAKLPPEPKPVLPKRRNTAQRKAASGPNAGRDEFTMAGWFDGRTTSNEARRRQSVTDRNIWARYFVLWGCIACEGQEAGHVALGFCPRCYQRIVQRIRVLKKRPECGT